MTGLLKRLSIFVYLYFLLYFLIKSFTTTPLSINEVDSLTYHIPIAQAFVKGNFFDMADIPQGLGFYPSSAELVLSIFMLLNLPLNLFNWLANILLAVSLFKLSRLFGLDKNISSIFSVSIAVSISVFRLIPTQTVDVWLAVFFVWVLIILKRGLKTNSDFLKLGLSSGMLVGAKYSGLLYAGILFLVYLNKVKTAFRKPNLKQMLFFIFPVFLFGVFWYLRNYVKTGNPFYPVDFLFFKGGENFSAGKDWTFLKVLFNFKGLYLTLQAFFSEFLLLAIYAFLSIFYLFRKRQFLAEVKKLSLVGFLSLAVVLPQPSWLNLQITLSNMRFLYPAMICITLAFLISMKKSKHFGYLLGGMVISSFAIFFMLPFWPKLFLLTFGVFVLLDRKLGSDL